MITADIIRAYRNNSDDFKETDEIKQYLSSLRKLRKPLYLNYQEFDRILKWKLRDQYGRQEHIRQENTDIIVKDITTLALNISHEDSDYELELRLNVLVALRGVAIPVASAVLALTYPEYYAVIDFRGWRQIFGFDKRYFTISDYKLYLAEIQNLANELGWLPQEVDLAIWEYDRQNISRVRK